MQLLINHTYRFSFIQEFSSLDGVYTVKSILSYSDIAASGIDLFKETYEPLGITRTVYDSKIADIRDNDIYKLESPDDSTVVHYMPKYSLLGIPEYSIYKYQDIGMAIGLGIYADQTELELFKQEIEALVASKLGVTNTVVLYSKGSKWLSEAEYAAIETARTNAITDTSNVFADKVALQKEIDNLRTKLIYYEDLIRATQP